MELDLPDDIIEDIFIRMPVKSLVRFKCLCRSWLVIIESSDFINKHIKHSNKRLTNHHLIMIERDYDIDYYVEGRCNFYASGLDNSLDIPRQVLTNPLPSIMGVKIAASCNGLLLLYDYDHNLALWNPFTRRYKKIHNPLRKGKYSRFYFGFGYDSMNDDYKVVRLSPVDTYFSETPDKEKFQVKLYSMRSNTWIGVRDLVLTKDSFIFEQICDHGTFLSGDGAFVTSASYWFVIRWTSSREATTLIYKIIFYNFGLEEFQVLWVPLTLPKRSHNRLKVIQECLYLVSSCYDRDASSIQATLYQLKRNDSEYFWSKSCVVGQNDVPWKLSAEGMLYLNRRRRVILLDLFKSIILYDLQDNTYFGYDHISLESLVKLGEGDDFDGNQSKSKEGFTCCGKISNLQSHLHSYMSYLFSM